MIATKSKSNQSAATSTLEALKQRALAVSKRLMELEDYSRKLALEAALISNDLRKLQGV